VNYFSFFLFLIHVNICFSQILPPSVGVHHKLSSSDSDESFVIDFDNDDDCTSNCSSSFYGEVPWTTGDSASGDVITFSSVAIQDGIYSIASADSNL